MTDPADAPDSLYPVIESFIENATPEEVQGVFTSMREGLAALKGPRAEQAKKVERAIEQTESLLRHLLSVRERLEREPGK